MPPRRSAQTQLRFLPRHNGLQTALLSAGTPATEDCCHRFRRCRYADYNRQFLALLANNQIGAIDRANGTGPFGHDSHAYRQHAFQADLPGAGKLAKPSHRGTDAGGERHSAAKAISTAAGACRGRRCLSMPTRRPPRRRRSSFSGLQARSVEIVQRQSARSRSKCPAACDGALAIRAGGGSRHVASGVTFRLRLSARGTPPSLFPAAGLNRCDLKLRSSLAPAGAPLIILREEIADPRLAALDSRYQRCAVPDPSGLDRA